MTRNRTRNLYIIFAALYFVQGTGEAFLERCHYLNP